MRKLSVEETKNLAPGRHGRSTYLRQMLLTLEVGESVEMKKEEWKGKGRPADVANRIRRSMGWDFIKTRTENDDGWNFKRVK